MLIIKIFLIIRSKLLGQYCPEDPGIEPEHASLFEAQMMLVMLLIFVRQSRFLRKDRRVYPRLIYKLEVQCP